MSQHRNQGPESTRGTQPAASNDFSKEAVASLIERARQAVKQIVKRELESEVVEEEVLNIRLKLK
jgi:hypothetical protein